MSKNVVQKILGRALVSGEMVAGETIAVKVDQVLTQDATGTMAYLQFEAIGVPRIKVPLAVSYVDHNLLQTNFRNADDHRYLQTAAARYGAHFSRPGNGICHQVHLERFSAPGKILLGSDSHTPTGGGVGMIAIGVGGLDVATVMAGSPYELQMPKVLRVVLKGELQRPWVTGMEVIMEILGRLTVKGGVGRILEYGGPGVKTLSVTERATITNMGAELGATTSIFPSDEVTLRYLRAQQREEAWQELAAAPDASYDEEIEVDLGALAPLVCQPHSPDNVAKVRDLAGKPVHQACVGSCSNSSLQVMQAVGNVLRGRTIAPGVSMTVSPGSKQVFETIARSGHLGDMIGAGARVLECACGPCLGMGQTPANGTVSLRTFNRNFKGRWGDSDSEVYLCSPLTAAVCALKGEFVDPREAGIELELPPEPESFLVNDNSILVPPEDGSSVDVVRGPNIREVPLMPPLTDVIETKVALQVGDNITTDDIMPAGPDILPLRSNIPAISEFVYSRIDPTFPRRAQEAGSCVILGGTNYGQGSSREHAAIAPMHLGVRAVIAQSFARIHRDNLINFGILPLELVDPGDAGKMQVGDSLEIVGILQGIEEGRIAVRNTTNDTETQTAIRLTDRQRDMLRAGGLLSYVREKYATEV